MKDDLRGVHERNVGEGENRPTRTCPEGYCDKTLRLEKELTRWKREEAVLRDIEQRYLAFLDSPLLILLILSEGKVLFMNRRGEEFFGFPLRERPRFRLSEYAAPGFALSVDGLSAPGVDGVPCGSRLIFVIRSEEGLERQIDCAFVPGVYQGEPVLLGAGYELPEKTATEPSLLYLPPVEREDLLLCSMDLECVPSFMTEGFKSIFALIHGQSPEKDKSLLELFSDDACDESFCLAIDRVRAGEYAETALEVGDSFFSCSFAPIYSREGEMLGISLLLTDKTEQCQLERELRALESASEPEFQEVLGEETLPDFLPESVQLASVTLEPCDETADEFLRSLLAEREDVLLCALDTECIPSFMTKGFEKVCTALWGRLPEEGEPLVRLIPSGVEGESFRTAVERARDGESSQIGQESGESYFILSFSPAHDAEGHFSAISLVATDKTGHRALERKCRAEADTFHRLFSSSTEPMLISTAAEGRVLRCNRAFLSRMGYAEADAVGRTEDDLGIYHGTGQRERLLKELDDGASVENFEVRMNTSSGEVFPGRVSVERIEMEGRPCILSVFQEVLVEKLTEAPVEKLAEAPVEKPTENPPKERRRPATDSLSGLPNREGFEQILNTEIERAMRYRGNISLVLIDVDGFGALNEELGRDTGDRVLKDFCAAVKSRIRPTDFIGRWGGDEFAVLTPMSGPLAFQVAEVIRDMIYHYKFFPDRTLSSSMGVAEFRRSMDMNEFVQRAEDALANAKRAGGNTSVLAPFVP